jgi:predicted amidohydrolase YtcJ
MLVRSARLALAAVAGAAAWLPAQLPRASAGNAVADLVLTGGRVFTADSARPWAEAIAIRGDRVLAVGTTADVNRLAGPRTRRVALGGRLVVPGLNDAHDHVGVASAPFGVAVRTSGDFIAGPPLAEVLDSLRAAAARTPPGTWLRGDLGLRILTDPAARRAALDAVTPNHPVMLWAPWGHGTVVNSAAMRALGIRDDVRDPALGGWYERDAAGRPTGSLAEYVAWEAQRRLYSAAPDSVLVPLFRRYGEDRVRYGVTSVQAMTGHFDAATTVRVARAAQLPIRLRVIPYPMPDAPGRGMAEWRAVPRRPAPRVTVSGVKYALDGTPIEQFALERAPYRGRPGWHGRLNFPADTMRAMLREALASDEPLMLHVVGDSTTLLVLSMMEALAPSSVWRAKRVRIEHGRGITGAAIARAARLGIVIAQPRPGAPLAAWRAAGIPVAYGSDVVPNPWVGFAEAIAPSPGGPPTAAPSREAAMALATRGAAFAEFAEREKGVLAAGMLADLAVLSQDVFTVPAAALPATRSVLTMVGGQVAYDAGTLQASTR